MSIAIEQSVGCYIYGIVRSADASRLNSDRPAGLNESSLDVIAVGGVAAIVSLSENVRLRPQRKLLAAHQRVVDWISNQSSMLPVAFGLIADDEEAVRGLLEKHQEVLLEQLELTDGRVEMTVTLKWSVENVFQYFVEQSEELKIARETVAAGGASRDDLIAVGQLFEKLLQQQREELTAKVIAGFSGLVIDVDQQNAKDEAEIFRASFLVSRNQVEEFEQRVYEVASKFNENFSFSFNGPWPPYSFVKLNLAGE